MKTSVGAAVLAICLLAGVAQADHHHHHNVARANGSGFSGKAGTGHHVYTHARNGRAHAVTLHHPRGGAPIRHQRVYAKGRRGRGVQGGSEGAIPAATEMYVDESGKVVAAAANAQFGAFIGFVFFVLDLNNVQHMVIIWLPLPQVDPQAAQQAQDVD